MAYFKRLFSVMLKGLYLPRFNIKIISLFLLSGLLLFIYSQKLGDEQTRIFLYGIVLLGFVVNVLRITRDMVLISADGGILQRIMPTDRDPKAIGRDYFLRDYARSGRPYKEVRHFYSSSNDCIYMFQSEGAPKLRKICVLGTATGEVLQDFYKSFDVRPWGCEISQWAYQHIPSGLRGRIRCCDMRDYVKFLKSKGQVFDLTFSCALMYLDESEVKPFLTELSTITAFLHFEGSYLGRACPDPYRRTLKPETWWQQQFEAAGFEECINMWGGKSYLWRSTNFFRT